jgi:diketogulonate reductase-like aldo/keto reductase/alkylhydroperoxidase/carboxymuconolactone decarboxylase family protein YurZ
MNVTLNNGVQMPALGFGVFQTPPDVTAQAVGMALATGYRLIDTAAAYGNEREVGEAIRRSGLARDEVFIETKIWISDYGYDQTLHAFGKSASKLGVDRIDLLILHQALPTQFDLTQEAYRALESLLADGRVRAIGVSNFMPGHLDALLTQATVVPAVNQVEVHPYFTQPAVQAADAARGILTQAWSPIGGITSYRGTGTSTFDDPAIASIAAAYGKAAAQVMIRWHLQEGRSAIPKSVRPERIAENFDVFDFELTPPSSKPWTRSTPACAAALSPTTSRSRPTVDPSPKPDLTTRDRRWSRKNRNPAMEEQQTPAQRLLGDFAPKMVQLTDDVLFGDVWKRPGLSPRDRSLVTVAVLAATYRPDQLNSHLRRALANGLTQDELVEALTHLAFYAGWPSGMAALTQLKTITADTGSGASR